jgi:WD40 repeat protein
VPQESPGAEEALAMLCPSWRKLIVGLIVLAGFEPPEVMPLAAGQQQATDRYGDPLPQGAIARLGTIRLRHASQVVSVAYSPDGKMLATGGYDESVRVWETAGGKELFRLPCEGTPPYDGRSVAFSTDGRLLACGKEDGSVELWQVPQWKAVGKGQGPPGRVYALCFSADGRILVSGHENTTGLVWDVPRLLDPAR